MKLKNKTTFITGASAGIGKSCAEAFASEGSNLILIGRRIEKLDQLKNELQKKYDIKIFTAQLDVRNFENVKTFVQNLPAEFKKIDILINNAGKALGLSDIQNGDIADWDEMIDTNIKGLLYTTRIVAPIMVENKGGLVINISSIAGRHAYPKGNVYCATKSAVRTLSEAMAIDFNGSNVKICNIDPGMVETEFSLVRFKGDKERADNVYKNIEPLQGDDIADIALFVATRPKHVMIQDILVTPTAQASAYIVDKK